MKESLPVAKPSDFAWPRTNRSAVPESGGPKGKRHNSSPGTGRSPTSAVGRLRPIADRGLKKSYLGERYRFAAGDDDVVEEADVDQRQRFFQASGDQVVGMGWLGHSRRMVVGDEYRGCVLGQRQRESLDNPIPH